jgi:hypothetical protein
LPAGPVKFFVEDEPAQLNAAFGGPPFGGFNRGAANLTGDAYFYKKAGIVLILKTVKDRKYWIRLNTTIEHITLIESSSIKVLYVNNYWLSGIDYLNLISLIIAVSNDHRHRFN